MQIKKTVILFICLSLFTCGIAMPVLAYSSASAVVSPHTLVSQGGTTIGNHVSVLGSLQQAGTEDDPQAYLTLSTPNGIYLGYQAFQLPSNIAPATISSLLLQVNFKGPADSTQVWTWSIYHWQSDMWIKLGDTIGTKEGQWNNIVIPIRNFRSYLSPSREIRIQVRSSNGNGDAKIDYEAIHATYIPVSTTLTHAGNDQPTQVSFTKTATTPSTTASNPSTPTQTSSATFTLTPSATASQTISATTTPTRIPSQTSSSTFTPSPSVTATQTASATYTSTQTSSQTPTATFTATRSTTPSGTAFSTPTNTSVPCSVSIPPTLQKGQHPYTSTQTSRKSLLYVPNAYGNNPQRVWPLIVFLHGAGTRGDSLNTIKFEALPQMLDTRTDFPAIVLSPQLTNLASDDYWTNQAVINSVFTLMNEIQQQYCIDPTRIYLTGFSLGGQGSWGIGLQYPNKFAALVPVAGFYGDTGSQWVPENICDMKNVPIWAFHGAQDSIVPVQLEQDLVNAVNACGGNARISIWQNATHDISAQVYINNDSLYTWLFSQTLSNPLPTSTPSATTTTTFTVTPSQTPSHTPTFTATNTLPPTPTKTLTASPTASRTPTPVASPTGTQTPSSVSAALFAVGPGGSDVTPHQIVRTNSDHLYIFSAQQSSKLIRVYRTVNPGYPTSAADFMPPIQVTETSNIISIDAVYDGNDIIHALINTQSGQVKDYPFHITTNTFSTPITLATNGGTVSGMYVGTGGVAGMIDLSGILHVAWWTNTNHILHQSFTYNSVSNSLTPACSVFQVDTAGKANHPVIAVSPLDNSVTVTWVSESDNPVKIRARVLSGNIWGNVESVSTSPVWTSPDNGINIDQGPSLIIDPAGTKHLTYIQAFDASIGDYGRIHYVTNSGSGWVDQTINALSHDPALAINNTGEIYIIGHGHQWNSRWTQNCLSIDDICTLKKNSNGTWDVPRLLALHPDSASFDSSPSVKWSAVGFNRPEAIELIFFSTPYESPILYYARLAN